MGHAVQSLLPTEGTWTITYGGFGADPTIVNRYEKIGTICHVYGTTTANGTSNATTFTLTLPFISANTTTQSVMLTAYHNNGSNATIPGRIVITANSNVASLYINQNLGAWTASSTKGANFSFVYNTIS